jgi:uncharacterized protein
MPTQVQEAPTTRKTLPGKFVWFEHVSGDPKKAQAFYREVLGWKVEPWGDTGYEMVLAGDTPDSMIGGYTKPANSRQKPHWISYVSVDDVDAAAKAAKANGGRVIEEPHDLPEVGRAAKIADPQGAELYVFKNAAGDPPDPADPTAAGPPPLRFFWSELHTTDPQKALSFYEKVVGFTHETMHMGPGNDYHVLSRGGVGRGGVTGHLSPDGREKAAAPHWLPYVSVDDPDATLERAKKAGGKVHVGATDIPGIGRFGVLEDPTGAALAVMKALPPQKKRG